MEAMCIIFIQHLFIPELYNLQFTTATRRLLSGAFIVEHTIYVHICIIHLPLCYAEPVTLEELESLHAELMVLQEDVKGCVSCFIVPLWDYVWPWSTLWLVVSLDMWYSLMLVLFGFSSSRIQLLQSETAVLNDWQVKRDYRKWENPKLNLLLDFKVIFSFVFFFLLADLDASLVTVITMFPPDLDASNILDTWTPPLLTSVGRKIMRVPLLDK